MLEDKQDTSRAEGMHTAACGEQKKDGQASAEKVLYMYTLSLYKKKKVMKHLVIL